jgi:hypothetical protein
MSLQANIKKHGVETHIITLDQETQKCTFCWQSNVDSVLELLQTHPQVLPGSWTGGQSVQHCVMLEDELKPTIHRKYKGMLTNGAVLHRDNA